MLTNAAELEFVREKWRAWEAVADQLARALNAYDSMFQDVVVTRALKRYADAKQHINSQVQK